MVMVMVRVIGDGDGINIGIENIIFYPKASLPTPYYSKQTDYKTK